MLGKAFSFLAVAGVAIALRPNDTTICDYYTPIITGEANSPASQLKLMLLITHTFVLGNYPGAPNVGVDVVGVAGPRNYSGHEVNLLPYFTGGYVSTNQGGKAVAKNWLDDGGADALLANKPALTNTSSQYTFVTHVYQYFGNFYGCSHQGTPEFPNYQGVASMYEVHKFMEPNVWESQFFNQQIVLATKAVGFEDPDVEFTRVGLDKTFTYRCIPPAAVIPPDAGPQLQSICVGPSCPLADPSNCSAYPDDGYVAPPAVANVTLLQGVPKENDTNGTSSSSAPASSAIASSTASESAAASASASGSGSAATPSASSTSGANANAVAGYPMVAVTFLVALVGTGLFTLLL